MNYKQLWILQNFNMKMIFWTLRNLFDKPSCIFPRKGSKPFTQSARTIKTHWIFQKKTQFSQDTLRTHKMKFWQPRWVCFAIMDKTYTQNPWKKKTNFQRTSFPQTVTVDNTSTLLTGLPRSYRKIYFAVGRRKLNTLDFFMFF